MNHPYLKKKVLFLKKRKNRNNIFEFTYLGKKKRKKKRNTSAQVELLLASYVANFFHPLCPELSSGESDYELEYEILSSGSAEPWDDTDKGWVSASGSTSCPDMAGLATQNISVKEYDLENLTRTDEEKLQPSTSTAPLQDENDQGVIPDASEQAAELDEDAPFDFEDLEQLMSEIGNTRESLRLMPDFRRREMAAKIAMKMAAMFGGGSDDDEEI
jgi:hypothetical protein